MSTSSVHNFGTKIDMDLRFFALVHKYSLVLDSIRIEKAIFFRFLGGGSPLLNYIAKKGEFLHFLTKSRFSQNCLILAFFNFRYTSRVQILFKYHQILNICFRDDYGGTYQMNFEKKIFFRILRPLLRA